VIGSRSTTVVLVRGGSDRARWSNHPGAGALGVAVCGSSRPRGEWSPGERILLYIAEFKLETLVAGAICLEMNSHRVTVHAYLKDCICSDYRKSNEI
jgi:hypothetical protein